MGKAVKANTPLEGFFISPKPWVDFIFVLFLYRGSKDTKKLCKKLKVSPEPLVLKHYK